jgi:zinc protease
LTAAEQEARRIVQYGVRQDELDREIAESRVALQAQLASASTRRTPRLASALVNSLDDDEVYLSPQGSLDLFEAAVKGLTADKVNAALKQAFAGEGPLVFMSTPQPVAGGQAAVAAAFAASRATPVQAPAASTAAAWPYQSFGAPGMVADEKTVLDLDSSFVRFANGVRLTVKPTKFRRNQVLVEVRIGDGRIEIPKDRADPSWAAGFAFVQGGLKSITYEDMQQALASKIFSVNLGIGDDAFTLQGATQPEDLDTEMQVLTAYVAEPGWRPESVQRMRDYGETLLNQMNATAPGVMRRDLPLLMHSGDLRWAFPDRAQVAALKPDDIRTLLEKPLAQGAIEVTIVGDITLERATQAVAATLGALPQRPAPTAPTAPLPGRAVHFPAPDAQPVMLTHGGRADQAIAFEAWPTNDFYANPQEQRDLRLAERVLNLRLIDEVRVAQGATYSPGTGLDTSEVFPGYGYVSADVEIPPAKVAGFFADVSRIVADLRTKPVGADELERARKPWIETRQKQEETNEYWLTELAGAQADPRRLDAIRQSVSGVERVTAADIQRAAAKYLTDDRAWKLVIGPAAGATAP